MIAREQVSQFVMINILTLEQLTELGHLAPVVVDDAHVPRRSAELHQRLMRPGVLLLAACVVGRPQLLLAVFVLVRVALVHHSRRPTRPSGHLRE